MFYPRPSHVLKNFLILPGAGLAWILSVEFIEVSQVTTALVQLSLTFLACCIIAAWNYLLNDFCDSEGDRWHPEKCERITRGRKLTFPKLMLSGILLLSAAGLVWFAGLDTPVTATLSLFVLSGAIYNIPPIRLKQFPFLDVMTEAANFPIRLTLGWYAIIPDSSLPPLSALLAVWAFGGVLLTGKRAAELARINDPTTAHAYRPALLHYTRERALVISSLYGMVMLFGAGVLFAVYSPLHNLIFLIPAVLALMGIYLWKIADEGLSARELEPEKLLRRPFVLLTAFALVLLTIYLVNLPIDLTAKLGFFGSSSDR
ncbi:MAG: decaprenyl-phosphate phosphoribosyltransferase [Rubritalea sp.]|jgi:decaprenyl-phosphate phosphoribosyltransferase